MKQGMNALLRCTLVLCLACAAQAKGWGRRGVNISFEEAHWNDEHHLQSNNLGQVQRHHLPHAYNWCDVEGVSFCSASLGQHDQTLVKPTYCGACWVHGTLSALQDRLKIKKFGKQGGYPGALDTMLSRQSLLNCAAFEGMGAGCDGGDPIDVFRYMAKFGLPDSTCQSYTASDHTRWVNETVDGHCPPHAICSNCMPVMKHKKEVDTCWAVEHPVLYKVKSYGRVEGAKKDQEVAMMNEIYNHGPIVCSIATPEDFTYGYRRGIYNDSLTSKEDDIDHNVEVVGWGREHEKDFWIVRNSWGTFWGELGFFRIPRAVNSLMIENGDCWYADVSWGDEKDVRAGKLAGSMYGLIDWKEEDASEREQPAVVLEVA